MPEATRSTLRVAFLASPLGAGLRGSELVTRSCPETPLLPVEGRGDNSLPTVCARTGAFA